MGVLTTKHNAGGRDALYAFTNGIEFDLRIAPSEVCVQKVWAEALKAGGYISADELTTASSLLDEALAAIEDGSFEWRTCDEDIHMNLERFMTERAGELGKKIHMGRSRNDLVATTLRLHVSKCIAQTTDDVAALIEALCSLADKSTAVLVPGLSHMQHGQPVSLSHIIAAHASAFTRDLTRLRIANETCLNYMPLGSAAFAGTSFEIDLDWCASELGFASTPLNSYDSVGDRDYMIETMDAFASIAVHMAKLCEEVIFYSASAVALFKLPRDWSTGSSIMPNKRNPDVVELARARCTRITSMANEAHGIVMSLPTGYGSDLHELKKSFIMSSDETSATISVLTPFVQGLEVDAERAEYLLGRGHILATEVACALTSQGMSFRDAYRKTAALVEMAESKNVQIHELSQDDFKSILPENDLAFVAELSFKSAVEGCRMTGGTASERVRMNLGRIRSSVRDIISRP
jgi:argininosuccinate lyase